MANGKLAGSMIQSINTWQQFYSVPTGYISTVTINICNQSSSKAKVRIAIPTSTTVNADDIIEYDVELYPHESFQRSGVVLGSGQYVYVFSDQGLVSVNIWGFEEN
jgi:hypothetical protein